MITDKCIDIAQRLESFYTEEGGPAPEWTDPEKIPDLWEAYKTLMVEWEDATIQLYETALNVIDGRRIYEWRVSHEILKLKLHLLDQVGGDLYATESPAVLEQIHTIERIFERINNEQEEREDTGTA